MTAPRAGRDRPGWPMAAHQLASAYDFFVGATWKTVRSDNDEARRRDKTGSTEGASHFLALAIQAATKENWVAPFALSPFRHPCRRPTVDRKERKVPPTFWTPGNVDGPDVPATWMAPTSPRSLDPGAFREAHQPLPLCS